MRRPLTCPGLRGFRPQGIGDADGAACSRAHLEVAARQLVSSVIRSRPFRVDPLLYPPHTGGVSHPLGAVPDNASDKQEIPVDDISAGCVGCAAGSVR
jgi:hypothetical protein